MQSVFDRDLWGHIPLHKILLINELKIRGVGSYATMDKSLAPNVSAVQRFHCREREKERRVSHL